MAETPPKQPAPNPEDAEVDTVIEEAGGDPRHAIRNLLHDLTQLAQDADAIVSRGYVRSRLLPFQRRRRT